MRLSYLVPGPFDLAQRRSPDGHYRPRNKSGAGTGSDLAFRCDREYPERMAIRIWALAALWLAGTFFGCYRRTIYCADDFPCDPGNTCNLTLRLCEPLGDGATGSGGDGATADGSTPAAPACTQFKTTPISLPSDPSSLTSQSNFGAAVALSSTNWVAIGAPGQGTTATGAVYLYSFSAASSGFGNAQILTAFPALSQAGSALAFSTDGNTLFIGAPAEGTGKVYIYQNNGATWTAAPVTLPGPTGAANFGQAMAVNDSLVVVGAPAASSNDGAVFTFRAKSPWPQLGAGLPGSAGKGGYFGAAVGVANGQLLVGAPNTATGDVSAYTGTDGSWTASSFALGALPSTGARFGSVIATTDTTALIGSPMNNGIGSVSFLTRSSGPWMYQSSLNFPIAMNGDGVGSAVALYGSSAIVGASNAANTDGAAAVFPQAGTGGSVLLLSATATAASPTYLGSAVALNANLAVVGARGTVVAGSAKGRAFAYPCMQ